jgi:uncharacterized membrane protein HdeD (DUF308 family)
MKKVLSVILFILALWFVAAGVLNAVFRSRVGLEPEYGVVCVLPLLGGLLAWRGVALWRRS